MRTGAALTGLGTAAALGFGEPIPTDSWKAEELDERVADVRRLYLETLDGWPDRAI